jgi:hypothetical protein
VVNQFVVMVNQFVVMVNQFVVMVNQFVVMVNQFVVICGQSICSQFVVICSSATYSWNNSPKKPYFRFISFGIGMPQTFSTWPCKFPVARTSLGYSEFQARYSSMGLSRLAGCSHNVTKQTLFPTTWKESLNRGNVMTTSKPQSEE